MVRERIKHWYT